MVEVRRAVAGGLVALVLLLTGLSVVVGLAPAAWGVGLACGAILAGAVTRGVVRGGGDRLGPADLVTLGRATIACAVAALAVESSPRHSTLLVVLAALALVLDGVDGRVARATGTQTGFGARFDGEADAFLILVLSVHVAQSHGPEVLAIGAARYVFGLGGLVRPWLRGQLPPRYWRKVVAAVQGVVLVVAAADVLPPGPAYGALGVAFLLLVESFGRDVLWLERRHRARPTGRPAPTRTERLRTT